MSTIYLVRHGQAGTRDHYDALSALGCEQARLLGEYLSGQELSFDSFIAGSLCRQRQTAEIVRKGSAAFPEIEIDSSWDEFDLTRVYKEIAPQLAKEDADFARDLEAMKKEIRISQGATEAAVHRQWQPCDSKVVQAWMSGRYAEVGESWEQFRQRVCEAVQKLSDLPSDAHVAIFTSATPIGIWTALAMDIFDQRSLRLAGVVHNSSFTVFRLSEKQLRLFTFNATPHICDSKMRTHR